MDVERVVDDENASHVVELVLELASVGASERSRERSPADVLRGDREPRVSKRLDDDVRRERETAFAPVRNSPLERAPARVARSRARALDLGRIEGSKIG